MKGICGIACDPLQNKYLTILETRFSNVFRKDYAFRVEYRIDENYTIDVYDSCKQVVHPSSGRQAMELACGTDAALCDHERMFWYMGDPTANPLVPFKIEYVNSEDPDDRFTSETKTCEEAYEGSYACSCTDCAESCPTADPPLPDDPGYLIFDFNGTAFIIAIIIGSFGVIALIFASVVGSKITLADMPQFLGGFEEVDKVLSKFFRWWGRSS